MNAQPLVFVDVAGAIRDADAGAIPILRADLAGTAAASDVVVVARASQLEATLASVRAASPRVPLRGVVVELDLDPRWMPQLLARAGVRDVSRVLVHRDDSVPRRVVRAWSMDCADVLIADADALDDALLVVTCDFECLYVAWEAHPALARLSHEQRAQVGVASDGSHVAWEHADVHLDLEAIRVAADPRAAAAAHEALRVADARRGAAMRDLRECAGLRQTDIAGVTSRQIRRIEQGLAAPRLATYERLAAAHGMTLTAYLDALAVALTEPPPQ